MFVKRRSRITSEGIWSLKNTPSGNTDVTNILSPRGLCVIRPVSLLYEGFEIPGQEICFLTDTGRGKKKLQDD